MSTVTTRIVHDGPRNVILHVYVEGGAGGDVTDEVLYNPALTEPRATKVTVVDVLASLDGFSAILKFDELTDGPVVWVLPDGPNTHQDFSPYGGFKDPSGIDGSGKVMISTRNLEDGDKGSIYIKLNKS